MESPMAAALGPIWAFSVPTIRPDNPDLLLADVGYAHYTTEALTPQAALNKAQVALDRLYGPGRWAAAQAVVLTKGANRIIVERVGE
jgi:hypothetical protein